MQYTSFLKQISRYPLSALFLLIKFVIIKITMFPNNLVSNIYFKDNE